MTALIIFAPIPLILYVALRLMAQHKAKRRLTNRANRLIARLHN